MTQSGAAEDWKHQSRKPNGPQIFTVDGQQVGGALPAEDLSRNAVIKRIRQALKRRSGHVWSVRGGTGTAYGWITIRARSEAESEELTRLLGFENRCPGHESIPASHDYYREYIDRAEGRVPAVAGKQYWD